MFGEGGEPPSCPQVKVKLTRTNDAFRFSFNFTSFLTKDNFSGVRAVMNPCCLGLRLERLVSLPSTDAMTSALKRLLERQKKRNMYLAYKTVKLPLLPGFLPLPFSIIFLSWPTPVT